MVAAGDCIGASHISSFTWKPSRITRASSFHSREGFYPPYSAPEGAFRLIFNCKSADSRLFTSIYYVLGLFETTLT